MDNNDARKSYRFIEMGEMSRQGSGTPVHQNTLQLDLAAIEWFSKVPIKTLYIKNNISNEMRKFTVNVSRQTEFHTLAKCFHNSLDVSKVNNVVLSDNDRSATPGASGKPISSTPSGVRRVTDISLLNDEELIALRKELEETKKQLREEINAERAKAEEIKTNLREEVSLAKETCSEEKSGICTRST